MTKVRLHHFDILKGLAIFMVIMGHVLTMCIRDIDSAVLFKFVERIHMPIFFFISGYFSYKLNDDKLVIPKLGIRVKQLLIPFFVMSSLWIYYFPHSGIQSPFVSTWEGLYTNVGKNGYWFTLCLFEIILLYCAIIPIISKCKTFITKLITIIISWMLLGCFTKYGIIPDIVNNVIGLPLVFEFYPIFMFGALAHSEKQHFDKITANSTYITISMIIGAFLMYYVCWSWEFSFPSECLDIAKTILYLCVVIIAISVVKSWCKISYSETNPDGTYITRMWEYIGSKSLSIYVLHYFFLFPMPAFREPLIGMHLNFIPTLIVAAFFAIIIITVVLGANYIIEQSKPLALLMTGKVK